VLSADLSRERVGGAVIAGGVVTAAVVIATLSPIRAVAAAQGPAQVRPDPRFEVVSVRPNRGADMAMRVETQPGGRFVAINTPLRQLIALAYGVDEIDITGGPPWMNNSFRSAGWVNNDRFDVMATAEGELPPWSQPLALEVQSMLRSLLEDRFGLVVRTETREVPGFTLARARTDGQLGPALTPSTIDCARLHAQRAPGDGPPPCGMRIAPGVIVLEGVDMASLATALRGTLGRPVSDGTGLTGTFDMQLSWEIGEPAPDAVGVPRRADALIDALRSQAALRLDPSRHTVAALVVETARQPDPN
jgi:uncharacterized protein (TIGR03435 family)